MSSSAKIKQERNEKFIINSNLYWKETLYLLHNNSVELKFPEVDTSSKTEISTERAYEDQQIVTFTKNIGLDREIDRVAKHHLSMGGGAAIEQKEYSEQHIQNLSRMAIQQLFNTLVSWDYLTLVINIKSTFDGTTYCTYRLNSKGIEIGLKLQEHKDNDKRYDEQSKINNTLKANGRISAISSIAAVIVSVLALAFSVAIFNVNYESLNIAKKNQQENTRQAALLQKLINDVTALKSTKVSLVNLEKNQKLSEKPDVPQTKKTPIKKESVM